NGSAPYPAASYDLGVPAPENEPSLSVSGTPPDDPADLVTRAYVYTYLSELDEESAPSPASVSVDVGPDQTVAVSGLDAGPTSGSYNLDRKRLYRAAQGASGAAFQLVAELPLATTSVNDTLDDDQLGEVLVSGN